MANIVSRVREGTAMKISRSERSSIYNNNKIINDGNFIGIREILSIFRENEVISKESGQKIFEEVAALAEMVSYTLNLTAFLF